LQELLRSAAEEAGAVIILNSRVATIDETPSSSVAITNDGRRYEADLIVGADGKF
jgi:2-polyprenyl-6-methoxyphenol hydroxylase-like FAD-dependent oxidoreductase